MLRNKLAAVVLSLIILFSGKLVTCLSQKNDQQESIIPLFTNMYSRLTNLNDMATIKEITIEKVWEYCSGTDTVSDKQRSASNAENRWLYFLQQ